MKIYHEKTRGGAPDLSARAAQNNRPAAWAITRRHESGLVTFVFIALLAIMMILVTAEMRSLIHLRRETKLLEQQQIKRLKAVVAPANSNSIANSVAK